MANPVNGHIDFDERDNWNKAVSDIATHVSNTAVHVPTPPADSTNNYYLGNDLTWHKVPSSVIS